MGKLIKNLCKATPRKPFAVRESEILPQSSFLRLEKESSVTTHMTWLCITLRSTHTQPSMVAFISTLPWSALAAIVKFHSSVQSYHLVFAVGYDKLLRWPTTIEQSFPQKKPHLKKGKGRSGSDLGRGLWSAGPSYMCFQKETVIFVLEIIFKARLERKMAELPPNWHWFGGAEPQSRLYLLHFSIDRSYSSSPRLAPRHRVGTGQNRAAASAFSLKNPLLMRREEKQQHPLAKETGKDELCTSIAHFLCQSFSYLSSKPEIWRAGKINVLLHQRSNLILFRNPEAHR